jgi:hypothetical protein
MSMNIEDIRLILGHFEEPIFPRTISTKATEGRQIPIKNIEKAYRRFEEPTLQIVGLMHILFIQTTKG